MNERARIAKLNRWVPILNIAALIALFATLGMIFFYAPIERSMGNVQRLFYFHVGSAWVGSIAFFVALVGSAAYLRTQRFIWDTIALCSVEIGLVFLTMGIIGGSVWGKPAWNAWWDWTPRLTLVAIAWLTYVAYLMLRGAIAEPARRARFSAVYAIGAFVTIIMSYLSTRFLRDIHPVVFGGQTEASQGLEQGLQDFAPGLDSMRMGITITVAAVALTILFAAWLVYRIRLQLMMDESDELKARITARLQESR